VNFAMNFSDVKEGAYCAEAVRCRMHPAPAHSS